MAAVILDKFSNGNPESWVYRAESYFKFLGFSEEDWLPLPYFYLEGEALAWFDWLHRNKQFYDWNHFKEKLFLRFRKWTFADSNGSVVDSSLAYHSYVSYATLCSSEAQVSPLPDLSHNSNFYGFESSLEVGNSEAKHVFDEMSTEVFPKAVDETSSVKAAWQSTNSHVSISHFVSNLNDNPSPKMFDDMLHSRCLKVFEVVQSDAPIEQPDAVATIPESSKVQRFDDSSHRDMPERYINTTSLDRGSSERQIEFEVLVDMYLADFSLGTETIVNLYLDKLFMEKGDVISTGKMPLDEMVPDVEHENASGEVEHHEGILLVVSVPHIAFSMKFDSTCKDYSTIVVDDFKEIPEKSSCRIDNTFTDHLSNQFLFNPGVNLVVVIARGIATDFCVGDSGICFKLSFRFKSLTCYTVNVEPLLLMGSTDIFFFFGNINSMTQVWDPGWLWLHNHYWTCYFTRPTSDFITDAFVVAPHLAVVLNVAGKIHREGTTQVRAQVTFDMLVVFDPGGLPFDVLVLEDRDGVFEATLNDIATLFIYNAPLSVDNLDLQDWKATIHKITKLEYGLSCFGFYFRIESHSTGRIRVSSALGELRRNLKGGSNIDSTACLGMFETLELCPEVNSVLESMTGHFITLSRRTNDQLITMDLWVNILKKKGCQGNCQAFVALLGVLEPHIALVIKGVLVLLSTGDRDELAKEICFVIVTDVASVTTISGTVAGTYGAAGFFLICTWTIQLGLILVNVYLATTSLPLPFIDGFFVSNLEDKVLIEDRGIVMNQPQPNKDIKTQITIGLRRAIGPRTSNRVRLIWDPG